jgi:hypothetical protein
MRGREGTTIGNKTQLFSAHGPKVVSANVCVFFFSNLYHHAQPKPQKSKEKNELKFTLLINILIYCNQYFSMILIQRGSTYKCTQFMECGAPIQQLKWWPL